MVRDARVCSTSSSATGTGTTAHCPQLEACIQIALHALKQQMKQSELVAGKLEAVEFVDGNEASLPMMFGRLNQTIRRFSQDILRESDILLVTYSIS